MAYKIGDVVNIVYEGVPVTGIIRSRFSYTGSEGCTSVYTITTVVGGVEVKVDEKEILGVVAGWNDVEKIRCQWQQRFVF
jgi:hypothetical protein